MRWSRRRGGRPHRRPPIGAPFAIPEQQDTPGPPVCFVAYGEVAILKKNFERTTSADIEHERIAEAVRGKAAAMRAAHYERAAAADRGWYRERER